MDNVDTISLMAPDRSKTCIILKQSKRYKRFGNNSVYCILSLFHIK